MKCPLQSLNCPLVDGLFSCVFSPGAIIMQLAIWKKLVVVAALLAMLGSLATLSPTSIGQEAVKKRAATKEPAKAKGRLPAYYREVVTEEQRDKIYAIQAKFDAQIDALTAQLEDLRTQRDGEVEGVLSPEQKEKLAAARAAADSKRKKKSDSADAKKTVESEKKAPVGGK